MLRAIIISCMALCIGLTAVDAEAAKFKTKKVTGNTPSEITKACKKQAKNKGFEAGTPEYKKSVKNCKGGADTDGVKTANDNCPDDFNNDQADADGDGLGDVCDNCPGAANADQANGDGDTLGNACDNCAAVTNADQADTDTDGLGNVCDNCSAVANADQADADTDGVGNACETVDVVMMDLNSDDSVSIFYDVFNPATLADGIKAPDVILDNVGSLVSNTMAAAWEDCLAIANNDTDTVTVYDNFLGLSSGDAPDLTLNNATSLIDGPADLQFFNGDLFVTNCGGGAGTGDSIAIFRDLCTKAPGVAIAPDVVLTDNGAGPNTWTCSTSDYRHGALEVYSNDLYVMSDDALSGDSIFIFRDVATLATGDAPDVTINDDNLDEPSQMTITDDGLLLVSDDSPDLIETEDVVIWAFRDAPNLSDTTTEPAPSGWFGGSYYGYTDGFDNAKSVIKAGSRVWAGNGCDSESGGFGGFRTNANGVFPIPEVFIGLPGAVEDEDDGVHIDYDNVFAISCIDNLDSTSNGLFGVSGWDSENGNLNMGFAYVNPDSITDQQVPDLFLVNPNFDEPKRIDAQER